MIHGVGFYPSMPSVLSCRFGPSSYGDASFVNSTTIQCVSPSDLRAGLQYPVAITVDGKTYVTSSKVTVRATAAPRIVSVAPPSGFAGASVVVEAAFDSKEGFRSNETAYCRRRSSKRTAAPTLVVLVMLHHQKPRSSTVRRSLVPCHPALASWLYR